MRDRRKLLKFQAYHPNGFSLSHDLPGILKATATDPESLAFDDALPLPDQRRALPAAPFLVASVIETLAHSRYASVIDVVPGEADLFCVAAARASGRYALVLTSDSDLLIPNLGANKAVAFLDQLRFSIDRKDWQSSKHCKIIRMRIFNANNIALRLGLNDLMRLAYAIKLDFHAGLSTAIQRANMPLKESSRFDEFMSEYALDNQVNRTGFDRPWVERQPDALDPRVSEFFLQMTGGATETNINMYLPVLIEDPGRSSAWANSREIRLLAYSCLRAFHHSAKRTKSIFEFSRRGDRVAGLSLDLFGHNKARTLAIAYGESLEQHMHLARMLAPHSRWRLYAMCQILAPQDWGKDHYSVLTGDPAINCHTWRHVQMNAQVEAELYSLRILRQILQRVQDRVGMSLPNSIRRLIQLLYDMPPLAMLMPTRLEVVECAMQENWKNAIEKIANLHPGADTGRLSPYRDQISVYLTRLENGSAGDVLPLVKA